MYTGIQWQPFNTYLSLNRQVKSFAAKPSSVHQSVAFARITLQSFTWEIFLIVQIHGNGYVKKSSFFLYFFPDQVGGYVVPFLEGCCKTCKWLINDASCLTSLFWFVVILEIRLILSCMEAWSTDFKGCAFPWFTHINTCETGGVKLEESSLTLKGLLFVIVDGQITKITWLFCSS